jgi:hypothetical protein
MFRSARLFVFIDIPGLFLQIWSAATKPPHSESAMLRIVAYGIVIVKRHKVQSERKS